MNKQLQDKLAHAKREIKALKEQVRALQRENDELRSAARGALAAMRADK